MNEMSENAAPRQPVRTVVGMVAGAGAVVESSAGSALRSGFDGSGRERRRQYAQRCPYAIGRSPFAWCGAPSCLAFLGGP
jgi:hypothetical protein